MQSNKSGYTIDFINRDVKDFPATVTRKIIPRMHLEDIAMLAILVLIVLAFLGLIFFGSPNADGIEEMELNGEKQPANVAWQT